MKFPRFWVDMDEVFADFVGGFCRVYGKTRAEVLPHWRDWNKGIINHGVTLDQFWSGIHAEGESFWTGLEPLPWIDQLVKLCDKNADEWYILTTPSPCPTSYSGKVAWLHKYLGKGFDRVAPFPHKHAVASPGNLLIDDRECTVEKFYAHKGDAMLFPSSHNVLAPYAKTPVEYIEVQFEKLHQLRSRRP